jgi:serine/threonine protein kinase
MISKLQNKLLFDPPDLVNQHAATYRRNDFEFLRKIGDGAFGQVWKVKEKKTGKLFAIKQVQKYKVIKILPQFRRELFILYEINHPHIIKLYTHFEDDKCFYMLMELLEGGTLFHKLYREKSLLESTAAQYFREIVLALEYLHSLNPPIVHRDIKPENVLINKEGRVKLIDFGWANYCDRTRNTICGTIEYLSPEMIENKGHGCGVDIWCLGVLLFEMLLGYTPFVGSDSNKIKEIISEARIKYPLSIPPLAKDLISCMLEKNASKRIDIFQVKSHKWLKEILPIRETLVQDPNDFNFPCIINFKLIENREQITDTTNNSESDDDLMVHFVDSYYKKSITFIKDSVFHNNKENSRKKIKLEQSLKELTEHKERLNDLDQKILGKKKEILKITCNCKEMLSRVFDANLEIESLNPDDPNELAEKNSQLQKKNLELGKKCKLNKLLLESLRKKVNKESLNLVSNEQDLKKLHNTLKNLQKMAQSVQSNGKSSENELKLNVNLLKKQIQEKTITLSTFDSESLATAIEISNTIKFKMPTFNSSTREILKKIESTEEKSTEIEQQIQELKINYEMIKSSILHNSRKSKDEFIKNLKKEKEMHRLNQKDANEKLINEYRLNLSDARKINFPVDATDILKARTRVKVSIIQVLKNMLTRLDKLQNKKRNDWILI